MREPRRALRGRFLRRQICESRSVAKLIEARGPWAGLLFERMILWADDDGRMLGEARVVRAHCLPWHDRKLADVERDLEMMQELGMIQRYHVAESWYISFPNWSQHQPRQKADRYTPSELPSPDASDQETSRSQPGDDSEASRLQTASDQETSRSQLGDNSEASRLQSASDSEPSRSAEAEEEAEVEEEEEAVVAPTSGAASKSPPTRRTAPPNHKPSPARPPGCSWCTTPTPWETHDAPDVQRLMQVYHDAFRDRFGECPIVAEPDWAALKRLIGAGKSPPDIRDVIRHVLASDDGRMIDGGFKLRQIAAEYQGIKIALRKGVAYGTARFNSRPAQAAARRPAVSDPSSFGETGAARWD